MESTPLRSPSLFEMRDSLSLPCPAGAPFRNARYLKPLEKHKPFRKASLSPGVAPLQNGIKPLKKHKPFRKARLPSRTKWTQTLRKPKTPNNPNTDIGVRSGYLLWANAGSHAGGDRGRSFSLACRQYSRAISQSLTRPTPYPKQRLKCCCSAQ